MTGPEKIAHEIMKAGLDTHKEFRVVKGITEGAEHEGLLIDNCLFPLKPPNPGDDPLDKEDNELFALVGLEEMLMHMPPAGMIHRYQLDTWQKWIAFLLRPVAQHYGVCHRKLLEDWMDNWWPSMVSGGELPIWGYVAGEIVMTQTEAIARWLSDKAEGKKA
jgi:hypothetical protein